MAPLDLTLNDLEKSKSRSLTFWVVGDLCGIEIIWPAVYYNLNLDVTKESLLVDGVFCCPSDLSRLIYIIVPVKPKYKLSSIQYNTKMYQKSQSWYQNIKLAGKWNSQNSGEW